MADQENESDNITQPQMAGQEMDHPTSDGRSGDGSSNLRWQVRRRIIQPQMAGQETDHPTLRLHHRMLHSKSGLWMFICLIFTPVRVIYRPVISSVLGGILPRFDLLCHSPASTFGFYHIQQKMGVLTKIVHLSSSFSWWAVEFQSWWTYDKEILKIQAISSCSYWNVFRRFKTVLYIKVIVYTLLLKLSPTITYWKSNFTAV